MMAKKSQKKRIDRILVERGYATDVKGAQALIMADLVRTKDAKVIKASESYFDDVEVIVKKKSEYVSRSAEKLSLFIADHSLQYNFSEAICIDIGASTGGFTQVCLNLGAKKVYAVDVGLNQLDWRIRSDDRVISLEKMDFRELPPFNEKIDIVVCDLSFISTAKNIDKIVKIAPNDDVLYFILVKPQFELEKDLIPEGGIVEDEALRNKAVNRVTTAFTALGDYNFIISDSKILGRYGNREIMLHAFKTPKNN